jgi:hypothetical protein
MFDDDMTNLFNFDDEFRDSAEHLINIQYTLDEAHKRQEEDFDEIEKLKSELIELANKTGVSLESILQPSTETPGNSAKFTWDDQLFLTKNPIVTEAKIKEEVFREPDLLPPLSSLD